MLSWFYLIVVGATVIIEVLSWNIMVVQQACIIGGATTVAVLRPGNVVVVVNSAVCTFFKLSLVDLMSGFILQSFPVVFLRHAGSGRHHQYREENNHQEPHFL
ncbi:hypothetical protein L1887_18959 [Cichorium endivia]|nr:hypothetical protein L1887_18959 [Cichorium endivia]